VRDSVGDNLADTESVAEIVARVVIELDAVTVVLIVRLRTGVDVV